MRAFFLFYWIQLSSEERATLFAFFCCSFLLCFWVIILTNLRLCSAFLKVAETFEQRNFPAKKQNFVLSWKQFCFVFGLQLRSQVAFSTTQRTEVLIASCALSAQIYCLQKVSPTKQQLNGVLFLSLARENANLLAFVSEQRKSDGDAFSLLQTAQFCAWLVCCASNLRMLNCRKLRLARKHCDGSAILLWLARFCNYRNCKQTKLERRIELWVSWILANLSILLFNSSNFSSGVFLSSRKIIYALFASFASNFAILSNFFSSFKVRLLFVESRKNPN